MIDYQITEMAEAVQGALNLPESVQIEKALRKYWKDRIALTWCVEDVKGLCKEKGIRRPSAKKCREVLREALDHHDAEIGVNWLTLGYSIEAVFGE